MAARSRQIDAPRAAPSRSAFLVLGARAAVSAAGERRRGRRGVTRVGPVARERRGVIRRRISCPARPAVTSLSRRR
ncbi:unnamed protein product [Lampetra fluviatilis]